MPWIDGHPLWVAVDASGASHDVWVSDQLPPLLRILEESRRKGFLGSGEVMFHVEHAHGFASLVGPEAARILDLGSGGGVPGLVLALDLPDSQVTLLDASTRRCSFLTEAAARLGLAIEVRCGRAEELGHDAALRGVFDAVVSRSFGPPAVVAECAAPMLRVGGLLVVSEPPDSSERWDATGLHQVGLVDLGGRVEAGFSYRLLEQESNCPERFPRRVGVPVKRPLFGS